MAGYARMTHSGVRTPEECGQDTLLKKNTIFSAKNTRLIIYLIQNYKFRSVFSSLKFSAMPAYHMQP